MKRARIVGLCIVASFATSVLAAMLVASASASGPEYGKCIKKAKAEGTGFVDAGCTKAGTGTKAKYEWQVGGANGATYATVNKPETKLTLETRKKEKVVCTGEASRGKILSAKEAETKEVRFAGCQTISKKCSSAGKPEGEIELGTLQGELGIISVYVNPLTHIEEPAKDKIGASLYRQGNRGGEMVEVTCAGFAIKVKGTILYPVTTNKMNPTLTVKTVTVKFSQSGGKAKPENFVGGPKEILESKFGGGVFEQSGLTGTLIQTNNEAFEIKAA